MLLYCARSFDNYSPRVILHQRQFYFAYLYPLRLGSKDLKIRVLFRHIACINRALFAQQRASS